MINSNDEPVEKSSSNRFSGVHLAVRVHRFKSLLIRYWWILAITMAIGLAVQGYRCSKEPVRYVSSARMMVNGRVAIPQGEAYSEEASFFYGTQVTLMRAPETIKQAVERVRAIHPEISVDDGARMDASQEPRTSIFDLQVTSSNPMYAKLLLDAIMDTYLQSKRGRKTQTTNTAISAITEELARLEAQITADAQKLVDFEKENNVVNIEQQSTNAANYLVLLNNERAQLAKEHDLLVLLSKDPAANRALLPPAETKLPDQAAKGPDGGGGDTDSSGKDTSGNSVGGSEADARIRSVNDEIAMYKIQQQDLQKYLKDAHPKLIALTQLIDQRQKFLDALRDQNVSSRDELRKNLELQIQNLDQQISDWNQKALSFSGPLGSYEQIKSKIDREKALYSQLSSSIANVNLNQTLDQEEIVTLEPASTASSVNPNYLGQLLYGLIYGLVGASSLILGINRLDDKIDSPLELEENIDFPVVGQVPLAMVDRATNRVPLLAENDQRHVLLESHRNIRSSILFRASAITRPRSLLISSSIPGEGKSTLAANLAVTFAMAKTRVLLIDADFRKGLLHTTLNVPVTPGLSEYLKHQIPWRDAIHKTEYTNLDFMPRGKQRDQAGDYLLDAAADVLLKESVEEYDLVIWDSAPVLATDEASSLCSKVDGVVFLARVRYSSIHSVRSALKELSERGGKIAGVVLNAVQPDQPGYYDRYRYKEYYTTAEEA